MIAPCILPCPVPRAVAPAARPRPVRAALAASAILAAPMLPVAPMLLATPVFLATPMLLASPARAAGPVFPPAASLGLVPPAGMTLAKGFSGFEHRSGASIIIAEMPAEAYPQLVERFTPEGLRATGFAAQGPGEPLAVAGGEGRILRGTQPANGQTYAKWIAIVRGAPGTGLVTVQVPQAAAGQVPDAAVEAALRTIAFRAPVSVADQIAALPYTVGDLGGFRPVRVFMGNGLMLTDGPKDVDPEGEQALVVVTPSVGRVAVQQGGESALARKAFLAGLPQFKDVAITQEDRSTRGGAAVVRLQGTARDAKSGRPLLLTQTMAFEPGRYLRVLGVAGADKPATLAAMERVAASASLR